MLRSLRRVRAAWASCWAVTSCWRSVLISSVSHASVLAWSLTTGSTTVDYNEWTVGVRRYFATDTDRLARHGGLLGGGGE